LVRARFSSIAEGALFVGDRASRTAGHGRRARGGGRAATTPAQTLDGKDSRRVAQPVGLGRSATLQSAEPELDDAEQWGTQRGAPAIETLPSGGRRLPDRAAAVPRTASRDRHDLEPNDDRGVSAKPIRGATARPIPELELDIDGRLQRRQGGGGKVRSDQPADTTHKRGRPADTTRRRGPAARVQPAQGTPRKRSQPRGAQPSGHKAAERPRSAHTGAVALKKPPSVDQSYREVVAVAVMVVLIVIARPFLEPHGQTLVDQQLGSSTAALFGVLALGLCVVGAKVWVRGSGTSTALWLSGGGMVVLGVALASTAVSHAVPSMGLEANAETIAAIGSLAAAAVPLGFSIHGGRRAHEELTRQPQNLGYGLVLLVMSLTGVAAAYQMGVRSVSVLLASRSFDRDHNPARQHCAMALAKGDIPQKPYR